jgi:Ser/Thr protein kinase RdoA (MazF antagonist)
LLESASIPPEYRDSYQRCCTAALAAVDEAFISAGRASTLRLHGDFHPGNILWRDEGPHVVDLDDSCTGPAIQDLWMLLSGERETMRAQLACVLDGYAQFMPFDRHQVALIEPLRTLRMVHHNAWLAERWTDPAFPIGFPWFGSATYWSQQTEQLRDQIAAMREPPLDADGLG